MRVYARWSYNYRFNHFLFLSAPSAIRRANEKQQHYTSFLPAVYNTEQRRSGACTINGAGQDIYNFTRAPLFFFFFFFLSKNNNDINATTSARRGAFARVSETSVCLRFIYPSRVGFSPLKPSPPVIFGDMFRVKHVTCKRFTPASAHGTQVKRTRSVFP